MRERWERELRKLADMEPSEAVVRRRIAAGPRDERRPSGRDRVVAGVVAGIVAVGAIALVVRTSPGRPSDAGGSGDLPALTVSFHDSQVVPEGPDASYRRVGTTITYGDAVDESHTSTVSENAIVDWVAAEDLTRFVPGPTVGSALRFEADGDDPRVFLGRPEDWPTFGRFERIDRLPDEPGEYVLVFAADYPEGIARTARLVELVEPGTLQLVAEQGGSLDTAEASAFVDGRRTVGFLSSSWFTAGDLGGQSEPRSPDFGSDAGLFVEAGTALVLAEGPAEGRAGLFPSFDDVPIGQRLPFDALAASSVSEAAGRYVLALDVTWRDGKTGYGNDGTEERAVFVFLIEVVDPAPETPAPTMERSPSPAPSPSASVDAVTIDIRRSPQTVSGDPRATASYGDQEIGMCPDGWSLVGPDGTTETVVFDCGQERAFPAPEGTPITVTGDFASLETTGRADGIGPVSTDVVPDVAVGTIAYLSLSVTWDDGSTATFWLQLTVAGSSEASSPEAAPALKVRCGPHRTEVLTPVVAAQADGLHVDPSEVPEGWSVFVRQETPPRLSYVDEQRVGEEIVIPAHVGPVSVYCDGSGRLSAEELASGSASFRLVDPAGVFTAYGPECADLAEVELAGVDGVDPTDAGDRIRAALPGVLDTDVVEEAAYGIDLGSHRWWRIVRSGRIVAALIVGRQGGGVVHGWVCRSSGSAGS